ncbi:MAG: hypothetical protein ACI4HI_16320 [Lachnospiraceae bacterium]
MFDLMNIKMAVFDFDNTLCIHTDFFWNEEKQDWHLRYMLEHGISAKGEPNLLMQKFLGKCVDFGIRIGLISATSFYVAMKAKQTWAEQKYGVKFENFCVSTNDEKIHMMELLSEVYHFNPDQILLVDDTADVLCMAADRGFSAATPMEIMNYCISQP